MMMEAYIRVRGRVQGVGYRYFALRNAREYGLNGYVRNVPDGSVELRVEGEQEIIQHFKLLLERGPGFASVESVEITFETYKAKFKNFSVEY
jgi:acylphosphatase